MAHLYLCQCVFKEYLLNKVAYNNLDPWGLGGEALKGRPLDSIFHEFLIPVHYEILKIIPISGGGNSMCS